MDRYLRDKARWVCADAAGAPAKLTPETRLASSLVAVEIISLPCYIDGGVLRFDPAQPLAAASPGSMHHQQGARLDLHVPDPGRPRFFPRIELERVCESRRHTGRHPGPVIPGYESVNGSLGHGLGVATRRRPGLEGPQQRPQASLWSPAMASCTRVPTGRPSCSLPIIGWTI